MSERFDEIRSMYGRSFSEHGDTPSALLTPKGRGALRFRAVLPHLDGANTTLLDYGCGLGYLYEYLQSIGFSVNYTGIDMMPEFVEACSKKFSAPEKFHLIDVNEPLHQAFDVVFASGVFHIRSHDTRELAIQYAFDRIESLFNVARKVLICDFQSPFVDFQQGDALHFGIDEVAKFCVSRLSRRFLMRHDLLPYEFTLIAFKDDSIKRPQNIYGVDE